MKAEERHELRENDLASWLQVGLWNFLRQNGSYILLVLALGFLGYQLWNMYERKQEVARLNAWNDLRLAVESTDPSTTISKLRLLVESSPVQSVKARACLDLGSIYDRMLASPEDLERLKITREDSLSKSYDYYQQALTLQGDDLLVAGKAHLGLAAALEDRGEWDKALAEYQILADKNGKFANTAFVELAKDRIATLDERKNAPQLAEAFHKWQVEQANRPKVPTSGPLPSGLPSLPGLMNTPESPFPMFNLPKPSTPATAPSVVLPFAGPSIPGIAPATPASGPAPEPTTTPK